MNTFWNILTIEHTYSSKLSLTALRFNLRSEPTLSSYQSKVNHFTRTHTRTFWWKPKTLCIICMANCLTLYNSTPEAINGNQFSWKLKQTCAKFFKSSTLRPAKPILCPIDHPNVTHWATFTANLFSPLSSLCVIY